MYHFLIVYYYMIIYKKTTQCLIISNHLYHLLYGHLYCHLHVLLKVPFLLNTYIILLLFYHFYKSTLSLFIYMINISYRS